MKLRLSLFFLFASLLAGCAAPTSRWRNDASSRFNSAVSAGSQQFAPEETENIRQTLVLADRYFAKQLYDESERLYRLSCQKSQLLYHSLILNKVRQGSKITVENEISDQSEEVAIEVVPVSLSDIITQNERGPVTQDDENIKNSTVDKTESPSNATTLNPAMNARKTVKRSEPNKLKTPSQTTIYLTFDDGPSRLTLPIASYLNSQGIAATFFALGNNIKGHEKIVSDTIALGHRVGNHTLSHNLRKLNGSLRGDANEIDKTAAMLDKLGGDGKMVRIPYGAATKTLSATVSSEGGQIFDWDIDSLDTSKRGVKDHTFIEQAVVRQLQKSGKRHIIMLFHDGSGHEATFAAIRTLVPRLKQEGYRFGLLQRRERIALSKTGGNQAHE